MDRPADDLPQDADALRAALLAARVQACQAMQTLETVAAELAVARAQASDDQAQIAHLKLQIAKLQRKRFGTSSERTRL